MWRGHLGHDDGARVDPQRGDAAEGGAALEEPLLVREARSAGLLKYLDDGPVPVIESVDGDTTVYAFEAGEGPRCMRGGTFRFSVRDTGSENLLIFLQGGGTCWSDFCLTVTAATAGVPLVESLDPDNPSNPLAAYGIKAVDLGGKHSSDVFRHFVPGARVVKAFNHLDVNVLSAPEVAGGRRVLFYSGDDAAAKSEVRKLIEAIGFAPVDLGSLDVGGPLASLPFGSLAAQNFIRI